MAFTTTAEITARLRRRVSHDFGQKMHPTSNDQVCSILVAKILRVGS